MRDINFTPYNPEGPSLQTGDEGDFESEDKEKPRPLGRGYTGFTSFFLGFIGFFARFLPNGRKRQASIRNYSISKGFIQILAEGFNRRDCVI